MAYITISVNKNNYDVDDLENHHQTHAGRVDTKWWYSSSRPFYTLLSLWQTKPGMGRPSICEKSWASHSSNMREACRTVRTCSLVLYLRVSSSINKNLFVWNKLKCDTPSFQDCNLIPRAIPCTHCVRRPFWKPGSTTGIPEPFGDVFSVA